MGMWAKKPAHPTVLERMLYAASALFCLVFYNVLCLRLY